MRGVPRSIVVGVVRDAKASRRARVFLLAGLLSIAAAGTSTALGIPVVKRSWSLSYLLLGAGISHGLLAVGEVIAMSRGRRLLVPFLALGTNALFVYVLMSVIAIAWSPSARRATTAWLVREGVGPAQASFAVSGLVLSLLVVIALQLRRKGIVLRL